MASKSSDGPGASKSSDGHRASKFSDGPSYSSKHSCMSQAMRMQGGATPETNEIVTNICSCHNFFPLSSVQIIFIPACCLLCVL